jgi:hypothetical protein
MAEQKIQVTIDDRVRLMSAVLAVTDFPERAQQRKGHRPHTHARNTTKWLAAYRDHPAVVGAQTLLNQNAPLEALYTYALKLSFPAMTIDNPPPWTPPNWHEQLRDLYQSARLGELWEQDKALWQKAQKDVGDVLRNADYYAFLEPFVGPVDEQLIYMANISYPSDMAIGARVGGDIICVGPPRIAWGDNEPWPFNEDPAHVYSTSLVEYARLLMLAYLRQNAAQVAPVTQKPLPVDEEFLRKFPKWGDQFTELFVTGAVAIYLEQHVSPQEAKSFILMERKAKGVTILPGVVSVLQRYLSEFRDGKYRSFTDYLPHFPGHLRVAKKVSLL